MTTAEEETPKAVTAASPATVAVTNESRTDTSEANPVSTPPTAASSAAPAEATADTSQPISVDTNAEIGADAAKLTSDTTATSQKKEKSAHFPLVNLDGMQTAPTPVAPTEKLAMQEASRYGRVDSEGRVFVKDGDTEREVGQYPDAVPPNPLALYVRRFLDLQAQVDLAGARMPSLKATDIDATLKSLDQALQSPMVVGDLPTLRARVAKLHEQGESRKEELTKEREAAKAQALTERTKIVESAEKIANQNPERTQWKQSGERLHSLLESWKEAQRQGPRLDRNTEDALWKRFSSARTTFDRHRKAFFSQLDTRRAEVKAKKEALIQRAQELSTSTDWSGTSAAYRDLMNEWKAVGRASRKEDDALWERFRAAQQGFFDARTEANAKTDSEEHESLAIKEKLLTQAKALLPIKDLDSAKAAFRNLLDKWDEAGRVPRGDMQRLENGLRSVEEAIARAEKDLWNKTNPETKARAEGLVGQLEEKIAELEAKLTQDKAAGKDTKKLEEDLSARNAWLAQARKTAAE